MKRFSTLIPTIIPYLLIALIVMISFSVCASCNDDDSIQDDSIIAKKELKLEISFELIDSTKTIILTAKEKISDAWALIKEPIEYIISTPTLFGDLLIDQGCFLDGVTHVVFPSKFPGDADGNVEIYAWIPDQEKYGDVNILSAVNWGEKIQLKGEEHGKLWTTDPPVWMLIAFVSFLLTVWVFYIIVFIRIRRIKKSGKIDAS